LLLEGLNAHRINLRDWTRHDAPPVVAALHDHIISVRYYPMDISGIFVPDAAAQLSVLPAHLSSESPEKIGHMK
jgi:hypothetical protein